MKLTINNPLTSVYLSNFRSIIGPHEIRLAPVTFFYGPNSAGKSAVYAAIKLISDICKRIEPLSFVDKLRHAVRNHDYELDMIIGLSATLYDLPKLDELHPHSITRDFAETFPRLIQYFYDTRQPNSDEEKKPVEIGIRYSFDFEPKEEPKSRWGQMDKLLEEQDLGGRSRKILPMAWEIEINVDSDFIVALTPDALYFNLSHPIITTLNQELSSLGHNLTSLYSLFWTGVVIDGILCTTLEHEFRNGSFWVDEEIFVSAYNGEMPYEAFQRLTFILRSLMQFIVSTPLSLIAASADCLLHVGPIRKIPKQRDVTYLATDLEVYSNIQGATQWSWDNGTSAWHWLASDFNNRTKLAELYEKNVKIDVIPAIWQLEYNDIYKLQEHFRNNSSQSGYRDLPTFAVDILNDWLSSPQRFGLNYRIEITIFEQGMPQSYPETSNHNEFPIASYPDRFILIHLFDEAMSVPVNLNEVGAGIPQIIPVLAAGLKAQQSFIEQPELHIHPKLQTEIGDFFLSCWNQWRNNFIIETHSEHIALRLLRRIRETKVAHIKHREYQLSKEQVAFYYFNPVKGGTEVVHLRATDDGDFLDRWPSGFFAEREAELFYEDD